MIGRIWFVITLTLIVSAFSLGALVFWSVAWYYGVLFILGVFGIGYMIFRGREADE